MTSLAPFLIFFVGAIFVLLTRGVLRSIVLLIIPIIGAANLLAMGEGVHLQATLFDYSLTVVRADKLSLLFGYLFHLAAFIGVIFSLHVRDTVQHVSGVLYAGSALGAVFAGDMITLFVFIAIIVSTFYKKNISKNYFSISWKTIIQP